MEFIEGSRGIYRPVRVLFDTPIYERALQTCWHIGSYKSQIALMTELLRLQQNNQLPSAVTTEAMSDFLLEESKSTLRVRLWEFEQEDFDADVRPLLKLVWKVNNSMKMRDIQFEARRLLKSAEAAPPEFQHPKIINKAKEYARTLTEQQQQEAPSSKLLGPWEVVLEVVPKVLQGFWLPPPNTSYNMPSKQLSEMVVGVTKAVQDRVSTALSSMLSQVTFSKSIRDDMTLSIQKKVRQGYTREVFVKRLNCFAPEVLNIITDVTAGEICALFQPQTQKEEHYIEPADVVDGAEARTSPAEGVEEEPGLEVDTVPIRETISAVDTTLVAPLTSAEPPANTAILNDFNCSEVEAEKQTPSGPQTAPATPSPATSSAEPPVITAVQEDITISLVEPVQPPEPSPEPDCAVVSPLRPMTPPASVLKGEDTCEEPTRETDSRLQTPEEKQALLSPLNEAPVIIIVQDDLTINQNEAKTQTGTKGLFYWLKKTVCCLL